MATLRECIEKYEAGLATRPKDRPIKVIRVAMLRTEIWRGDALFLEARYRSRRNGRELPRSEQMAETGERLGLERVGAVARTEVES